MDFNGHWLIYYQFVSKNTKSAFLLLQIFNLEVEQ